MLLKIFALMFHLWSSKVLPQPSSRNVILKQSGRRGLFLTVNFHWFYSRIYFELSVVNIKTIQLAKSQFLVTIYTGGVIGLQQFPSESQGNYSAPHLRLPG